MNTKALGKRIQEAREQKGMTQEQLAEAVNYSPDHIGVIERGQKSPRLDKLLCIANVLDVGTDYLLAEDLLVTSKIESSLLFDRIATLSTSQQRMVLKVLDTLVSECEKEQ